MWNDFFSIQKNREMRTITFLGFTWHHKRQQRSAWRRTLKARAIQDKYDTELLRNPKKIVFLTPYYGSPLDPWLAVLLEETKKIQRNHLTLVATFPGELTRHKSQPFQSEPIFRWEQIMDCLDTSEELFIHLPDTHLNEFTQKLTHQDLARLRQHPNIRINIVASDNNEKQLKESASILQEITSNISLSVSSRKEAYQDRHTSTGIPIYYTTFGANYIQHCLPEKFKNREKIILVAPGGHPQKAKVLKFIKKNLPEFTLITVPCSYNELRTSSDFNMFELLTKIREYFLKPLGTSLFTLSFCEEDFSLFFIGAYCSNSIGITLSSAPYYPNALNTLPFTYITAHQMCEQIVEDIRRVCDDREKYEEVSQQNAARLNEYFHFSDPALSGIDKLYASKPNFTPKLSIDYQHERKNYQTMNSQGNIRIDSPPPLLTAILYTYNHETSIAKCIESLLNQKTDYPYEIHIWDDCSIDNTGIICLQYAKQYPEKIKLVLQPKNTFTLPDLEVQSFTAISNIRSKYFCCIDGDDFWCDENKIQISLDFLEANPEYIGFAHDTIQVDYYNNTSMSYIHELCNYATIENPVTLTADAPFFLTSSRIFRSSGYEKKELLPIDYKQYYYHLAQGPIFYYDKIMAAYVIGENNTFVGLQKKVRDLNSMFPAKLLSMFDYQHDDFCTQLLQKYDKTNGVTPRRYKRLLLFKKLFGVRRGWQLWFFLTFVPKFGFDCLSENYIYNRKQVKKTADKRVKREG